MTLDKPIYVVFSILDLTKLLMYVFHWKYIKRKHNTKLLFTETDSLVYKIKRDNFYEDFYIDKNLFGFSYYAQDSNLFDPVNKKVIGKMKNEFKEEIISEYFGLKLKMYSLIVVDGKKLKKKKESVKILLKA